MSPIARTEAPTPFGVIVVAVEHDGRAVDADVALSVPSQLSLTEGRTVDGSLRFEVTVRAAGRVSVAPVIGFEEPVVGPRFGFAGGQYLMAAQITDETGSLAIATHDGSWLASYAIERGLLPARFAALDPDDIGTLVRFREQGLVVRLPELEAGESARIFLSCAWALGTRSTDPDTDAWFAAEAALPWRFPQH